MSSQAVAKTDAKPNYGEMVMAAANALNKPRSGFSRSAIVKHLKEAYKVDDSKVGFCIELFLIVVFFAILLYHSHFRTLRASLRRRFCVNWKRAPSFITRALVWPDRFVLLRML